MEPTTLDIQRQGDLGGTKVAMKFDENSLAHIMSVLTDLYSDPALAIIREYSTNAWDAHIAAGNPAPIEVTTPSSMSPYFKVKDYGIGLSVDDISEIYSKYGASTKRETNEQVGMLGLGCKSALTYTQQFTLVAVKNGVKVTVSISRIEDGTGVMEIVDTRGTDEPNGVEVVIPVRQDYNFENKVNNFFQFWEPGTVLINGAEPARIEGMKVSDNITVVMDTRQDYVVMGNVGYPVKDGLISNREYGAKYGVVARVGIGEVNFTPSREQLHYTATTNATLERLKDEFSNGLLEAIQTNIDEAETAVNALTRYESWVSILGARSVGDPTYNGEKILTRFTIDTDEQTAWQWRVNYTRNGTNKITYVDAQVLRKALVIVGFDKNLSSPHRTKVREWAVEQGIRLPDIVIFMDEIVGEDWVVPFKVVDWADIKVTKVKRNYDAQGFTIWENGYYRTVSELESDAEIVYFSPSETDFDTWQVARWLGFEGVILRHGLNRHKRLVRDFENVIHFKTFFVKAIKEFMGTLTQAEKFHIVAAYDTKSILSRLDPARIDDPEVVKMIQTVGDESMVDQNKIARYKDIRQYSQRLYIGSLMDISDETENPLLRYPLVSDSVVRNNIEDCYVYMNSKYEQTYKNSDS